MKRVSLEEEVRWKIESFNVILHRTIIGVGLGDGVVVDEESGFGDPVLGG